LEATAPRFLLQRRRELAVLRDESAQSLITVLGFPLLDVHVQNANLTDRASCDADVCLGAFGPPRDDLLTVSRGVLETTASRHRLLRAGCEREDRPPAFGVGQRCLDIRVRSGRTCPLFCVRVLDHVHAPIPSMSAALSRAALNRTTASRASDGKIN